MIQFLNAATGTATTAEMLLSFLPMILIIVFMIILIYLPQKRQDKKDAAMRSSIEIGDKVTTIGSLRTTTTSAVSSASSAPLRTRMTPSSSRPAVTARRFASAAPQSPLWRSWTPVRTANPPPSRSN